MKSIFTIILCSVAALPGMAADKPIKFENALKEKIEATIEPAEAKPGQTVTLKIKVPLNPGWTTYPTVQEDPAAKSQINKIKVPDSKTVIFVGDVIDPANPQSKKEPAAFIEKLMYYAGTPVYEQKVVISPLTPPGDLSVPLQFQVVVCDKDNCIPKTIDLKATIKVAGSAVPVEAKYKEEVEKALKK